MTDAPIRVTTALHCLHDPKFPAGPYRCIKPKGHVGHHRYRPLDMLDVRDE